MAAAACVPTTHNCAVVPSTLCLLQHPPCPILQLLLLPPAGHLGWFRLARQRQRSKRVGKAAAVGATALAAAHGVCMCAGYVQVCWLCECCCYYCCCVRASLEVLRSRHDNSTGTRSGALVLCAEPPTATTCRRGLCGISKQQPTRDLGGVAAVGMSVGGVEQR